MKVKEYGFREIYHKVCYISLPEGMKKIATDFPNNKEATGVAVYGYIDHQAGLSFELLACAKENSDGTITFYDGNDTISAKYRVGSVADSELIIVDDKELENNYIEKIEMIKDGYQVDEAVIATRKVEIIDGSRSPEYPDDVLVVLFKDGNQPEGCWVRCEGLGENCLIGVLLNEPNADFSIHAGDTLEFGVVENDDSLMCVSIFE